MHVLERFPSGQAGIIDKYFSRSLFWLSNWLFNYFWKSRPHGGLLNEKDRGSRGSF